MADYTSDWADALSAVADAGSAVTFTTQGATTYYPLTDTSTYSASTVTGSALRVRGEPERYMALGLKISDALTLLFAPDIYGSLPRVGDSLTWFSRRYTVRMVSPVAPDGNALLARVIVDGSGVSTTQILLAAQGQYFGSAYFGNAYFGINYFG